MRDVTYAVLLSALPADEKKRDLLHIIVKELRGEIRAAR